jgi:adenine phosphoribosyltransferase
MESKGISAIVALFAVIASVFTVTDPEATPEYKTTTTVQGIAGENVTLPCYGTDTSTSTTFNWIFYFSDGHKPTTLCANGKIDGAFVDSCYLPRSSQLDYSIVIRSVARNQSGKYVCGENNGFGPFHQIQLVVISSLPAAVTPLVSQESVNSYEKSSECSCGAVNAVLIASVLGNFILAAGLGCLIVILYRLLNARLKTQSGQPSLTADSEELVPFTYNRKQAYVCGSCACQKAIGQDDIQSPLDKCWHDMFNDVVLNSVRWQASDGVMRDFCELMKHPDLLHNYVTIFAMLVHSKHPDAEVIFGPDTNGYVFALLTAQELRLPFVPVRKLRKLPGEQFTAEYKSRNDENELRTMGVQKSACDPGKSVVFIDEKLVTGETMVAAVNLMTQLGVTLLGCIVVVEDTSQKGRKVVLKRHPTVKITPLFVTPQQ